MSGTFNSRTRSLYRFKSAGELLAHSVETRQRSHPHSCFGHCFRAGSTPIFITVAICTFNRAESLRRTLDSVARMVVPTDLAWELVIVNNNSTDHTDEVISEYFEQLPVKREFEPQPGHSIARNRAIDAAKGEYIVWTDDDVIVDANWLKAYAEAFRQWPDAAVFGGRIIPRFAIPAAKWAVESELILEGAYARRDLGSDTQPLCFAEHRIPYGANFAIRAKEQRAFRYDPNLGLAPNRRRYHDEVDVIERLLKSGARGYWIPSARVEHCIGREKQTLRYIIEFQTAIGETDAFLCKTGMSATRFWFGVPRRLWPQLLKRYLLYRWHRLVSPPTVWVERLQRYAYTRGLLKYWLHQKECRLPQFVTTQFT
jgi:glucosyl-dolichyl phosphate glucuronosyltransferase